MIQGSALLSWATDTVQAPFPCSCSRGCFGIIHVVYAIVLYWTVSLHFIWISGALLYVEYRDCSWAQITPIGNNCGAVFFFFFLFSLSLCLFPFSFFLLSFQQTLVFDPEVSFPFLFFFSSFFVLLILVNPVNMRTMYSVRSWLWFKRRQSIVSFPFPFPFAMILNRYPQLPAYVERVSELARCYINRNRQPPCPIARATKRCTGLESKKGRKRTIRSSHPAPTLLTLSLGFL